MSSLSFTLTAHPSRAPLTILRMALIMGAGMMLAFAFAFPFLVEDLPMVQNVLFGVASLELVMAFLLPKLIEKHFESIELRFYTDRLEFKNESLPYASIREIRGEQSDAQKAEGKIDITILTHGEAPALTSFAGSKNSNIPSDRLALPGVSAENDPLRKIQKALDEYRMKIS